MDPKTLRSPSLRRLLRCAMLLCVLWTGTGVAQQAAPASAPPETPAAGNPAPKRALPDRQVPDVVLAGVAALDREFRRTLAEDCAPERCFAKGCLHISHTVVDQPSVAALPGLYMKPQEGVTDNEGQIYLTAVECSFAHEPSVRPQDAKALASRLKAKLSRAWTQIDVVYEKLAPLPESLRESPNPPPEVKPPPPPPPPPPPAPEAKPEPELKPLQPDIALRELWLSLLPHFSWMIAVVMLTFALLLLIWAWRRLGRESAEEKVLLAEMLAGVKGPETTPQAVQAEAKVEPSSADSPAALQHAAWRRRFAAGERDRADPALQALVADLFKTGERQLLAKASLLFPDEFPRAFPQGANLATARLELSEYLKHVRPEQLPSDDEFFDKLNRFALSSQLTADNDTDLMRSLHDELGPSALADLIETVSARHGALLFAHAPLAMQHEALGLLTTDRQAQLADQLLRSNRMDPSETKYLLSVLAAARAGAAIPVAPLSETVSDRGQEFGAALSLSVLLPRLPAAIREPLLAAAAARLNGTLPGWVRGTLYGEMLLKLPDETRTDLLLEADVAQLAAWLQVQTPSAKARLLSSAPAALQAALSSVPSPSTAEALHALSRRAHDALSAGLLRRVAPDLAFQTLLV